MLEDCARRPVHVDPEWIAAHLPHAGAMILIDRVVAWDAGAIHCRARSHGNPGNPLRAEGRLGAINGVEYAAQAVALHGALLRQCAIDGPAAPALRVQGYLAALREVKLHVDRLDSVAADLEIDAERDAGLDGGASYRYRIRDGARVLQSGRLTLRIAGAA